MTYNEAREYLSQAAKKGIVLGLQVMEGLLSRLGNPEKELNIVHIAGTNGKGSILACLEQIFISGGYRTGRYVSPVIGNYEERFLLSSKPVKEKMIPELVMEVKEAARRLTEETGLVPTVFELETAMAFLCFYKEKVDVVLLETGMGGRLDATNVVERPLLSIIASVSEDHMPVLGENLTEIAGEKAGIIKDGCPVLLYPVQEEEVVNVIRKACGQKAASLHEIVEKEITVIEETKDGSCFSYRDVTDVKLHLPGHHQIYNAVTAICAAEMLACHYPKLEEKEVIRQGIERARWKGRLEKLSDRPLVYLDGAHNKDGAKKLADFIRTHLKGRRIIGVTGVLADKDYPEMMRLVLPLLEQVYVFTPDNNRGLDGSILLTTALTYCENSAAYGNVKEAMAEALKQAGTEDVILLFGSLSFISELGENYGAISENFRAETV